MEQLSEVDGWKEGPRPERVPRHIETLRRSRSQSPGNTAGTARASRLSRGRLPCGRSGHDFHPSMSQRGLLAGSGRPPRSHASH